MVKRVDPRLTETANKICSPRGEKKARPATVAAGGPTTTSLPALVSPITTGAISQTTPEIAAAQAAISQLLREFGHTNLSLVADAFLSITADSSSAFIEDIMIASALAKRGASPALVASALCFGLTAPPESLAETINHLKYLNSLACSWTDGEQAKSLIGLLFQKALKGEYLLYLAVRDKVMLENGAAKANCERAFYVSSWILMFFGFEEEGGTLEDAAFLRVDPKKYQETCRTMANLVGMDRTRALGELQAVVQGFREHLSAATACEEDRFAFDIQFNIKKVASAAKKISFLNDVARMRIILNGAEENCSAVLTLLYDFFNEGWKEDTNQFNHYINTPKPNGYKSIHVTFVRSDGFQVEIQIRTRAMHYWAEFGGASHGKYKTGDGIPSARAETEILPQSLEEKFHARKDLLFESGCYFIYDPEGNLRKVIVPTRDALDAPSHPTLLDAAFTIGIAAGLNITGGIVDGKQTKIGARLDSGNRIERITTGATPRISGRADTAQTPFACAVLRAAERGKINLETGLNEESLEAKGRNIFEKIAARTSKELAANFRRHLTSSLVRVLFSLPRLYCQKGFNSEKEFFITLALLEDRDARTFEEKISERIREWPVLIRHSIEDNRARLSVLTRNLPGIESAALQIFQQYGIRIASIAQNRPFKEGSVFYAVSEYFLCFDRKEAFVSALDAFKNIYQALPPSPPHQTKKVSLTITTSIAYTFSSFNEREKGLLKALEAAGYIDDRGNILPRFLEISFDNFQVKCPEIRSNEKRTVFDLLTGISGKKVIKREEERLLLIQRILTSLLRFGANTSQISIPEHGAQFSFEFSVPRGSSRTTKTQFAKRLTACLQDIPGIKHTSIIQ